jgi:hypothetical protein
MKSTMALLEDDSRQVIRYKERQKVKAINSIEKQFAKASKTDPGLREALTNINVDLLVSFKDIFMNHHQSHLSKDDVLETYWKFTKQIEYDRDDIYSFERFELNSTGCGMDDETVEGAFTRTLKKEDRDKSKGSGIHSVGEKLFYELSIQHFKSLKDLGIEVLTKTGDMDEWYYRIYNPSDNIYLEQTNLTTNEAIERGLPVEKIGDKGSYIKTYFCGKSLPENWFEDLQSILNLYFMIPFRKSMDKNIPSGYWKGTLELDESNNMTPEVKTLDGSVIPLQGSDLDGSIFSPGNLLYSGKLYAIDHGIRVAQGTPEFREWEQKYGRYIAFKKGEEFAINVEDTRNGKIGDNLVVMFIDNTNGICYESRVYNSGRDRKNKGVLRIFVDKSNLDTDVSKNQSHLYGKKGINLPVTEKAHLLTKWKELHPIEIVDELQLRNQIVNILHGVSMPESMHPLVYKELCQVFECPPNDFEWAKKHITAEHPVLRKRLDIYNTATNHIFELKNGEPDGDEDLNQIVCYSTIVKNTKKVTMLGVSNSKSKCVNDINGAFSVEKRSTFIGELMNQNTLSHIEWNLVDLRYFDLHRLHKTIKGMK